MAKTVNEKIVRKLNELSRIVRKSGKKEEERGPKPPIPGPMGTGAPVEERVLLLLNEVNELPKRQVGMILGVPPKAIEKIVETMVEEQLISLRVDEQEEKSYIAIDKKGVQKLEQEKEERKQYIEGLFVDFTEEEKESLLYLLNKIKK